MEGSQVSVDVRQVLVVPTEVATSVDPVLVASVGVGSHEEPPERYTEETQIKYM